MISLWRSQSWTYRQSQLWGWMRKMFARAPRAWGDVDVQVDNIIHAIQYSWYIYNIKLIIYICVCIVIKFTHVIVSISYVKQTWHMYNILEIDRIGMNRLNGLLWTLFVLQWVPLAAIRNPSFLMAGGLHSRRFPWNPTPRREETMPNR